MRRRNRIAHSSSTWGRVTPNAAHIRGTYYERQPTMACCEPCGVGQPCTSLGNQLVGVATPMVGIHGPVDDGQQLRRVPFGSVPATSAQNRPGIVQAGTTGLGGPPALSYGAAVVAGGPVLTGEEAIAELHRRARADQPIPVDLFTQASGFFCGLIPQQVKDAWLVATGTPAGLGAAVLFDNWIAIKTAPILPVAVLVKLNLMLPFLFTIVIADLVINCGPTGAVKAKACMLKEMMRILSAPTTEETLAINGAVALDPSGKSAQLLDGARALLPYAQPVVDKVCAGEFPNLDVLSNAASRAAGYLDGTSLSAVDAAAARAESILASRKPPPFQGAPVGDDFPLKDRLETGGGGGVLAALAAAALALAAAFGRRR